MGTRVANPSDSKPLITEAEARDIAEDMREKGWHAMAFFNGQQHVVFAKDAEGKNITLTDTHEAEQYIIRRSIAWMLRNGPSIMLGKDIDE